eukprot:TRINITY_DN8609_c0_g4_i4.p4 TRINITY_DN8609_c0_g4~~TRINITY_DN8609_c0_g4_i4.p4  ORF type:complete len:107 (+),score=5.21 TRINITY_DN8609_c0_g4_i4:712-1032(+)
MPIAAIPAFTSRSSTCKHSLDFRSQVNDAITAFDVYEFPTTLIFAQGTYRTYLGPYNLAALEEYVGNIIGTMITDVPTMERGIPVKIDWWTMVRGYLMQWWRYAPN